MGQVSSWLHIGNFTHQFLVHPVILSKNRFFS